MSQAVDALWGARRGHEPGVWPLPGSPTRSDLEGLETELLKPGRPSTWSLGGCQQARLPQGARPDPQGETRKNFLERVGVDKTRGSGYSWGKAGFPWPFFPCRNLFDLFKTTVHQPEGKLS